jgi:hypothetical protein
MVLLAVRVVAVVIREQAARALLVKDSPEVTDSLLVQGLMVAVAVAVLLVLMARVALAVGLVVAVYCPQ